MISMRAKTLLVTMFLLSMGITGFVVLHYLSQKSAVATETKDEILVATMQLPAGTLLRAQDVTWQLASHAPLPDEIVRPSGNVLLEKPELDDQTRV